MQAFRVALQPVVLEMFWRRQMIEIQDFEGKWWQIQIPEWNEWTAEEQRFVIEAIQKPAENIIKYDNNEAGN